MLSITIILLYLVQTALFNMTFHIYIYIYIYIIYNIIPVVLYAYVSNTTLGHCPPAAVSKLIHTTLPVYFGRDTKNCRSLIPGQLVIHGTNNASNTTLCWNGTCIFRRPHPVVAVVWN